MALTDLTRISTSGIATGTSLSGAILHGDAHFRGTQVGVTSALFDSSDNALEFNDNVKLTFGDSGDLLLYHTGNNSIIRDQGTGTLSLQSNGAEIALYNSANSQYMGKFANNAQVELYHAGNLKITTDQAGAKVTGILTATGFSGPIIGSPINNPSGISTFYDLRVSNNLTVEGTTTTLDTNLIGVDRVEVGANSNTVVGVAVTQSGTADLVRLYDGSTQVVTIDDEGKVGLGTNNPSSPGSYTKFLEVSDNNSSSIIVSRSASASAHKLEIGAFSGASLIESTGSTSLRFKTNSKERLRIRSDGRVGINTNNPQNNGSVQHYTSTTRHQSFQSNQGDLAIVSDNNNNPVAYIKGTGSADLLNVFDNTTEVFTIKDGGKVGIGTDNPQTIFHISDNVPTIRFTDENSTGVPDCEIGGAGGNIDISADINGEKSDSVIRFNVDGDEKVRINSDGTVHTAMTGTAPSWLGNTIATREKFSVFQGANFAEACFNIDVDNANSFLSHNMYYDSGWKIKKSGQPARHLEIGTNGWSFMTGADGSDNTASALTNKFRIRPSGRIQIANNNEDIDMASDGSGQIQIDGNGYTGAITLNSQGMFLYHNSSNRYIGMGIHETEVGRFTAGGYEQRFSNSSTYSVGVGGTTNGERRGIYVFNDGETDGCYASLELAATNSNDLFGSTILNSISTASPNYSNHFTIQLRHAGNYYERLRIASDGVVSIGGSVPNISAAHGLEISNAATTEIRLKNTNGGTGQADGFAIQKWSNGTSYIYDYDPNDLVFGVSNSSKMKLYKEGRLSLSPSGSPDAGNSGFALSIVQAGNYTTLGSATGTYPGIHIKSTSGGGGNGVGLFTPDQNWGLYTEAGNKTGFAIAPNTNVASSANTKLFVREDGHTSLGSRTYEELSDSIKCKVMLSVTGGGLALSGYNLQSATGEDPRHIKNWYSVAESTGATYHHLVTSLWGGGSPNGNTSYIMGGFTIKGYSYGGTYSGISNSTGLSNEDIFFHNWNGTTSHGYKRHYHGSGFNPGNAAYVNSSGYVTLRLKAGRYTCYYVDLYQFQVYVVRDIYVTSHTMSNNTTI